MKLARAPSACTASSLLNVPPPSLGRARTLLRLIWRMALPRPTTVDAKAEADAETLPGVCWAVVAPPPRTPHHGPDILRRRYAPRSTRGPEHQPTGRIDAGR